MDFFAGVANTTAAIIQSRCGTLNSNDDLTIAQTVDVVLSFTQSVFGKVHIEQILVDSALTLGTSSLAGTFEDNVPRGRFLHVDNLSRRNSVSEAFLAKGQIGQFDLQGLIKFDNIILITI
ncbi:1399_t:CDS:2 [Funneliformis caledonium]|uniref:1399_t:CDS:1 n=1 Tax=Funneliformis caledonium TaxID=1117310 RepID=A0A9N9CP60_9GLOM|nr:1399_t:CDS:2 [Funneliformis caledonium]